MENPKTTRNGAAVVPPQTQRPAGAMPKPQPGPRFDGKPYLQCLESLENSFPALKSFLRVIGDKNDRERHIVESWYLRNHKRGPGRCYCLKFEDASVSQVEEGGFKDADGLREYLKKNPAAESRASRQRRLFILEDMDADYVDALGDHLGVDPLTFSEQANTWNFTDSYSIPHRGLPSLSVPEQAFTLRYYELRTLSDPKSVDTVSLQMTWAINRRRYERWRDIDVPSAGNPDRRHAFVRRCASFWSSQDPTEDWDRKNGPPGWDAVILVDPAFTATSKPPQVARADAMAAAHPNSVHPSKSATDPHPAHQGNAAQVHANQTWPVDGPVDGKPFQRKKTSNSTRSFLRDAFAPKKPKIEEEDINATIKQARDGVEDCLILKVPGHYPNRAALWQAQKLGVSTQTEETEHKSWPYHGGVSTLAPLMFSQIGIGANESEREKFRAKRDLVSPLDEMVFYWTKVATEKLIKHTNENSGNAAYYLLKHVAQHWVNHLELISTTIAKGEWFADDYQASIDDSLSLQKWKEDLKKINQISEDINYMRRHLNHFWSAIVLNLERLSVQLGSEAVVESMPIAIQDAQKDFLTIHTRMQPLRDRAEALGTVPSDLANLRAAFRGVHDSEFSLRLSLFASIVFPLTLVAGIFSMGDPYQPGKKDFWQLWVIGLPLCVALALGLVYGRRPWRIYHDVRWYIIVALGLEEQEKERMRNKEKKKKDKQNKKEKNDMEKEHV